MNIRKNQKNRRQRGTVFVEYGVLLASILVVGAAAVSLLGHKTSDMIGTAATILPGAHADDNGPIISGKAIETTISDGAIVLDIDAMTTPEVERLGPNLGLDNLTELILEAEED